RRAVVSCSEPVMAGSLQRFEATFSTAGVSREKLSSSYALAENTFAATQSPIGRGVVVETVDRELLETQGMAIPRAGGQAVASSGVALANTQIRLRRNGTLCGDGEVGDVEIASDCLFEGYFGVGA